MTPEEQRAEHIARELAVLTNQNFSLLMNRFDRIEEQNDEQLKLLNAHIEKDDNVHKVVERHTAYFSIISLGMAPLAGWLAYKLGIKP